MTPQEETLITQLFARLKEVPAQPREAEADRLISHGIAEQPDAPYLLVQTVLIQDMALSQAQQRIAELEKQLAEVGTRETVPAPQPTSFLNREPGRGSVPASPWHRASPISSEAPPSRPASGWNWGASGPPAGTMAAGPMPSAGSGFLHAAAATALGVAGGQLLFQGIESMFGHPAGAVFADQPLQPAISETVTNNYYGDDRQSAADGASGDSTLDNDNLARDDDGSHDANDMGLDDSDTAWNDGFGSDDTDLV
jgi:uncharacterized protein